MSAQWVKYDGSDEQLRQLLDASGNFIVDSQWSVFSKPTITLKSTDTDDDLNWLAGLLRNTKVKEYLICDPHPYADMICQWARTGQPVWVRYAKVCHFGQTSEYEICNQIATLTPDWNIPGAEYSFTPFEEEV